MRKFYVSLFVSAFVFISSITVASAQIVVPDTCDDTPILQSAYTVGIYTGENIVAAAWNAVEKNCDMVVQDPERTFQKIVSGALQTALGVTPTYPSPYVECRILGYTAGINSKLDEIQDYCEGICIKDGEFIGEMAAIVYCELSIIFDGMGMTDPFVEGELTVCGEAMTGACKSKFEEISVDYSNGIGDCEPYTMDGPDGDYEDVWELTENNQCIVNPVMDTDSEVVDGGVEDGGQ